MVEQASPKSVVDRLNRIRLPDVLRFGASVHRLGVGRRAAAVLLVSGLSLFSTSPADAREHILTTVELSPGWNFKSFPVRTSSDILDILDSEGLKAWPALPVDSTGRISPVDHIDPHAVYWLWSDRALQIKLGGGLAFGAGRFFYPRRGGMGIAQCNQRRAPRRPQHDARSLVECRASVLQPKGCR